MSSYLAQIDFPRSREAGASDFASASPFVCTMVLSALSLSFFTKYGSLRGGPSQKIGTHNLGDSPRGTSDF